MDWSDLRILLAVSRHPTIGAAARSLGCDPSTVTRRLAAAETALGARIFDRRGGDHALTGAGLRLRPRLESIEAETLAIERTVLGHDESPRGTVRVTTVESVASRLLAPRVPFLRDRFPEIDLELHVGRRALDLERREADIALRVGRPRRTPLIAKKVAAIALALYASEAYLARWGAPRLGEPCPDHRIVAGDEESSGTPEERMLLARLPGARVSFRSPSWFTRVAAAEAGMGVAALPCFVASGAPSLRRLGAEHAIRELWLVVHRDLQRVARVRAVLDFIADALGDQRGLLEGEPPSRRRRGSRS